MGGGGGKLEGYEKNNKAMEADNEVFVYTAEVGAVVPRDAVRVMVDPSVTSIPNDAFFERRKLAEVELCEGLVEIGDSAFSRCDHSITKINIPSTLRRINDWAFVASLRTNIRLHDGIESIGAVAFANCIFTNFRVPCLITVIPERIVTNCRAIFSLEISGDVTEIGDYAFFNCYCLRNVAFPSNAVFGDDIFIYDDDDVMTEAAVWFRSTNYKRATSSI